MELGLYCSLWLFIKEGVETARPLSEVDERMRGNQYRLQQEKS